MWLMKREIPKEQCAAGMLSQMKKKNALCENCRGINVLNTAYEQLTRTINN